jgi:hypothetical protein
MMNDLGVPSVFNIPSSEALFGDRDDLLHTSSVIRYPVFMNGQNYTGHKPGIIETPTLRWFLDNVLAMELEQIPRAVIVPLGKSVSTALRYLENNGKVDGRRCLLGFPHPSGANGHMKLHFTQYRVMLAEQITAYLGKRSF